MFVTQTSDYGIPATACVLQDRLGLSKSCIAFDVNLGCSGFTYGMTILGSLLMNTQSKYGLLLAGDTSANNTKVTIAYHTREYENFIRYIGEGTPLIIDGVQGRMPLSVILGVYESSRTGRRIQL